MTDHIVKALVIDSPWIDLILDSSKTWEMRSMPTKMRGPFGLIRKGSGMVVGVATLVDCGEVLSPDEMIRYVEKHQIPEHMIRSGKVAKWNRPWKLTSVRKLLKAVSYNHKPGGVTWVNLDQNAVGEIRAQLNV